MQRNRTYWSCQTRKTYWVVALGSSFISHEEETVGQLERILFFGDHGEDIEKEDDAELQPIFAPTELAEISKISDLKD